MRGAVDGEMEGLWVSAVDVVFLEEGVGVGGVLGELLILG